MKGDPSYIPRGYTCATEIDTVVSAIINDKIYPNHDWQSKYVDVETESVQLDGTFHLSELAALVEVMTKYAQPRVP